MDDKSQIMHIIPFSNLLSKIEIIFGVFTLCAILNLFPIKRVGMNSFVPISC